MRFYSAIASSEINKLRMNFGNFYLISDKIIYKYFWLRIFKSKNRFRRNISLASILEASNLARSRLEGLDDVLDLLPAEGAESATLILPLPEGAVVAEAHVATAVQDWVDVWNEGKVHKYKFIFTFECFYKVPRNSHAGSSTGWAVTSYGTGLTFNIVHWLLLDYCDNCIVILHVWCLQMKNNYLLLQKYS